MRGRAGFSGRLLLAVAISATAFAEYRKEPPVALVAAATGGTFIPQGTRTPLSLEPGVFLFAGDSLIVNSGPVRIYWCPEGGASKFEYTIERSFSAKLGEEPPQAAARKALDVCRFPRLERNPEVAIVPSLSEMLPEPTPADEVEQEIASLPPNTSSSLTALRRSDLNEPRNRLAYAAGLAAAGLNDIAMEQYAILARLWPNQPRLLKLIFDLRQTGATREIVHPAAAPAAPKPPPGKTYALVIGISAYASKDIANLQFADADAEEFSKFAASPRGGSAEEVKLINEQARVSTIRTALRKLMAGLGKNDTLLLFAAAHGGMDGNMPTLITYRANPQEPNVNSIPLSEIEKLRSGEKAPFREVRVFLDLCHAGNIARLGPMDGPRSHPDVPAMFFTATHQGPDAFAFEDPVFGHGLFSYYLLRGLSTDEAAPPGRREITAQSLTDYIGQWVKYATSTPTDSRPRQTPNSFLYVRTDHSIASLDLPAPQFSDTRPLNSLRIPAKRLGANRRQSPPKKPPPQAEAARAEADLDRQIELEDRGEEVLLKYLEGDEQPQDKSDFAMGAAVFRQALAFQPNSPYLKARAVFCEGRVAVFDKDYVAAVPLLERSILLDPTAAYTYNALGIAHLERGDYATARLAFEDAIERAPKWAYPRHNLALTDIQDGQYEAALQHYREAIRRAPDYFYLPYNLGLLYHRLNRLDEAAAEYQVAIDKARGRAEPYIGLGLVQAAQHKNGDAEQSYRKALAIPQAPELSTRTARHNLAALLARTARGKAEAERQWKANGSYLPSQLALAQFYSDEGRGAEAISVYRHVLRAAPDHLSSRLELASQLAKSGDRAGAIIELRAASAQQPNNPVLLERLGDALAQVGDPEALAQYRAAIAHSADSRARSRMEKAVKRLERRP